MRDAIGTGPSGGRTAARAAVTLLLLATVSGGGVVAIRAVATSSLLHGDDAPPVAHHLAVTPAPWHAAAPAVVAAGSGAPAPGTQTLVTSRTALFSAPAVLPDSSDSVQPVAVLDHHGRAFVSAVRGFDNGAPSTPVWASDNGGRSFGGPVGTANAAGQADVLGGAADDIIADNADTLVQASLWTGNTSITVSGDHGRTWSGVPFGHPTPVDEQSWLAYDALHDDIYMVWDGVDGYHVGKALLRSQVPGAQRSTASMVFVQDVVAVPELPTQPTGNDTVDGQPVREGGNAAPGSITVDPFGHVWFAFARQGDSAIGGDVAIAESVDGGLQWSVTTVPGSGSGGSAASVGYGLQVIRSDSAGNMYLVWTQAEGSGSPHVYYSYLPVGATVWHQPILVPTVATAAMATLAVVTPGVVDIAYYGTQLCCGSPAAAPKGTLWSLLMAQSRDALGAADFTGAAVLPDLHVDAQCVAPPQCGMGLTVDSGGMAVVATVIDDVSTYGTRGIGVVRQVAPFPAAAGQLVIPPPNNPFTAQSSFAQNFFQQQLAQFYAGQPRAASQPAVSQNTAAAVPTPLAAPAHPQVRLGSAHLPSDAPAASNRLAAAVGIVIFLVMAAGSAFIRSRR